MTQRPQHTSKPALQAATRMWAPPTVNDLSRLSRQAPQRAGDLAFFDFSTPSQSERRAAGHAFLVRRARRFLAQARQEMVASPRGPIPIYIYDPQVGTPRATVLVAHGWTAEASFMTLFGERLRHMGYRAILMDAPAHGHCPRRHAILIDYADAVLRVADAMGPITTIIAHSMGCFAALLAGAGGPPFHHKHDFASYVLVASPNKLSDITRDFADARGLTPAARRAFERHLERVAHRDLASFTAAGLLAQTGRPALLLHARDDHEIPIENALSIRAAYPAAQLHTFDGVGHRRILSHPPVVRAALSFLQTG